MSNDDVFDSFDEIMDHLPEEFNIFEEEVNVDVQKDFFKACEKIAERDTLLPLIDTYIQTLQDDQQSVESLRETLLLLSHLDSINAYRALELYQKNPHPELKDWATLALQHSRMIIYSSLMGEQQVFVSTGLGGKNGKLRYFLFFRYVDDQPIYPYQEKVLHEELQFFLSRENGEIEDITVQPDMATATVLIPTKVQVPELLTEMLKEVNQYGNFVGEDVFITNVKKFTPDEIRELFKRNANAEG
jgi:hypothetical protein